MARPRRSARAATVRARTRSRHGRELRSSVAGPDLPFLRTRTDLFDMTVASTAEYLRSIWPNELAQVSFEVAAMPFGPFGSPDHVDRWAVTKSRVILFRLPIERMAHLHRDDEVHRRLAIESCVFRAVAELLGKDPWDIAPDRFRHL
ncbi:metallopeptidase family protein [Herbiconiux moechotypicola]|uniref:Metallopeptidase family protein n=1 Tax=Herbiconiux moechotypicola TaxID=637393 RepID=A0ABN3DWE0_9MICO|nr:metallopeptidase family protein [Herbiconiux moechotypicola]MCS5731037.1 metallopeptidase family protein [Herbiconiux moechotypicola]